MEKLYTIADGQGSNRIKELGYDVSLDDQIVARLIHKLNMATGVARNDSVKIWGWDRNAMREEDWYRADQVIRGWLTMEKRILSAFRTTAEKYQATATGETAAAFKKSLDTAAARRLLDGLLDGTLVPEDERGIQWNTDAVPDERLQQYAEAMAERWPRNGSLDRSLRNVVSDDKDLLERLVEAVSDAEEHAEIHLWRMRHQSALIDLTDPEVARLLPPPGSPDDPRYDRFDRMWRLMDRAYTAQRIADPELRDLVDYCLGIQAEYQLQALLTQRELTKVIDGRGREFEYLKAKAAAEEASGFWGFLGDALGIASAVFGVLALIPVLTPICGPVALVTAVGSLAAHTVDAALKGDWDAATIAGLGADVLAVIPGISAVAKGLKAGTTSMRAASGLRIAARKAGRAFLTEVAGKGASEATTVFNYLGQRGAKALGTTAKNGTIAAKVMQGSVNLANQIPLTVELATGTDMSAPKTGATGTTLVANYGQSIGSWGAVGSAAQKAGTVSLATFGKIIGRR
ncbi:MULTISPECIES: hypothetical protein [unclassified Streptomyces]|uniref:hypothetical protein n=1 Tax=unclassified Streptomyces TaxID=2593676 RepID=UPI00136CA306|nr:MULTISPECIES: hypothetical protein [unclassified Streptomyces]NEA00525.1 hypothetical protein [Streptomyces sp. SID10116]MYY81548.1 hypothetical protein [Streptomyces sp. SID335]MYZ18107.1 hypothetical protein [Streptomyces sp. SID337]NDZ86545.1 hypothetical protein [Streptomyces sp. SID10115]NEB45456.1 hypothetical protein [Streptomyces sp. SID339]